MFGGSEPPTVLAGGGIGGGRRGGIGGRRLAILQIAPSFFDGLFCFARFYGNGGFFFWVGAWAEDDALPGVAEALGFGGFDHVLPSGHIADSKGVGNFDFYHFLGVGLKPPPK
jgi:hypothetical protein